MLSAATVSSCPTELVPPQWRWWMVQDDPLVPPVTPNPHPPHGYLTPSQWPTYPSVHAHPSPSSGLPPSLVFPSPSTLALEPTHSTLSSSPPLFAPILLYWNLNTRKNVYVWNIALYFQIISNGLYMNVLKSHVLILTHVKKKKGNNLFLRTLRKKNYQPNFIKECNLQIIVC